MRFIVTLLLLTSIAQADEAPLPTFCDLVKQRAINLLYARFQAGFDLVDAKSRTIDEPMFEAMLAHAWTIRPRETTLQQVEQIREFADHWYGICVLG